MKIIMFGRFPSEDVIGGVTSLTTSFSKKFKDQLSAVVDFYPSAGKKEIPEGIKAVLITGSFFIRYFKLFRMQFQKNVLWHYHFSAIKGIILFLPFPKRKGTKWMVMAHNGDQEALYNKMNPVMKFLLKIALKRIDALGCCSEKQFLFFSKLCNTPLYRYSPFIKFEMAQLDSQTEQKKTRDQNRTKKFLISGYPTKIYSHQETLTHLEALHKTDPNFTLDLCLYGSDSDQLLDSILNQAGKLPFVTTHQGLSPDQFHNLLTQTDLYIRMNLVDGFGLVVAEAVELGIPVIATRICERYPGSFLVEKNDFDSLQKGLKAFLQGEPINLPKAKPCEDNIDIENLYQHVLEI